MDRSYFHALQILLNQPKKTIIWPILLFLMILLSVLRPIRPRSTQWIMMMATRADVFSLSVTEIVLIWLEVIATNKKMSGIM
jgi:hypothetical protein